MRLNAYQSSKLYKECAKFYHYKRILKRSFYPSQFVLLFNSRLKSKWSGPFFVKQVKPYGAVELEDPESQRSWIVNGQRLKHYLCSEIERLTTVIHLRVNDSQASSYMTLNKRFLGGNPVFMSLILSFNFYITFFSI